MLKTFIQRPKIRSSIYIFEELHKLEKTIYKKRFFRFSENSIKKIISNTTSENYYWSNKEVIKKIVN